MFRLFRIIVEIPALDRFLDYLEAQSQTEVDTATAALAALAARLASTNTRLLGAINKEI